MHEICPFRETVPYEQQSLIYFKTVTLSKPEKGASPENVSELPGEFSHKTFLISHAFGT